jgi:hypothetical protein
MCELAKLTDGSLFGARRGGKDTGVVEKIVRTSVVVRFERNGLVRRSADLLAR